MKKNIAIVSLSNNYSRTISKNIADFLELFYADLNDIMEYNMVNDAMLESAGREYFEKEKQKVVASVAEFENTLLTGDIELFLANDNFEIFRKNFILIYLDFDNNDLTKIESTIQNGRNLVAYKEEDEISKKNCDIVISMTENFEDNIAEIKKSLIKYLEESVWILMTDA